MKKTEIVGYVLLLFFFGISLRITVSAQSSSLNRNQSVAFVGAKLYPSPTDQPISNATVIVTNGRIVFVGKSGKTKIPKGAVRIDCAGLTMTAAFWNSHVHFTEAKWRSAESLPAEKLNEYLRAMLTRYGFVRVLDTGSSLKNTLAIKRRIETGEVEGPTILTTGSGFVPPAGSPFYILPSRLPELSAALEAENMVNNRLNEGADAIKLFTGSWASQDSVVLMPTDIVRAVVSVARRRGKLVVAHPSNGQGAKAALDGGADLLVHTFPEPEPLDRAFFERMGRAKMGLIPTLKLFKYEIEKQNSDPVQVDKVVGRGVEQLRAFNEVGGQILFGTDVGYMTEYDPSDEYVFMKRAGLSFSQILASLTTAPAARFGHSDSKGVIAPGMDADLVLLSGDPATDIKALSNVRYTIRGGKIIYQDK
jgi:imidazolonepropionase-like amidohydrolase